MEEIKPKKERKFLKAVGKVAGILLQEFVLGLGRKFIGKKIDRIGNKRQALLIFLALFCNIAFASIDSIPYPITGNKQRLGWQTSGNGLVYRGRSNDTITKPTSYADKNVKAYLILDSVRGTIFVWRQTYWDSLLVGGGGGGGSFTQPVDSLFFNTSVPTNNVDTAKMRWDSDLATVVLGMYDQVPNELGFKSFWLVKNQTGSTIAKGSIVYANGTVGASGRITVAKFIANGTIEAKYLLGVTAHDLTDGEDGYVISFGKIRQVNTDTFAAGAILYPSPTTAGVWTDIEPVAPNIDMPIGFCINSSVSNGTIAIRVASGYKLSELHDVAISSPVDKASLYYKSSEGLWRDTTAALLVSDTAAMLSPYFRDADTTSLNLTSRFAAKLNISDTSSMLTPYLKKLDTLSLSNRINLKLNISDTSSMLSPYFRDADTTSLNLTSRFAAKQNTLDGTGFVKTSGTSISYDNSTYLTTSSASSTYTPLTRSISTTSPLQGGGDLSSDRTLSILSASETQSGILTTTAQNIGGSKAFKANIVADSFIYLNNTSPIPTTLLGLNTSGNVNNVGRFTLGAGLSITSGSLLSDTSFVVTRFDTASMLTNYLRTGVAASTYLPLTGGTLTGDLNTKYLNTFAKTTYTPFNAGIGEQSIFNVGTTLRGGTVMVFPDSNLVGSSANIFLANSSVQGVEYSAMGSGMRNYAKQGGDSRRNSLAFYTSGIGSQNTNRLFIDYDGNVGINDDTPSYKLDVNGTLGVTGAATFSSSVSANSLSLTTPLSVANGGTNTGTLTANKVMVGNGTSGVLTPTNLHWDNTNSRLAIGQTQTLSGAALSLRGGLHIIDADTTDFSDNTMYVYPKEQTTSGKNATEFFIMVAGPGSSNNNDGPAVVLRGNNYVRNAQQKGFVGFYSGNNITEDGRNGQIYFSGSNGIDFGTIVSSTEISRMYINKNGNIGIGTTGPTARLHLPAGTSSASSAPLKFTSGTNMTTAEAGAMEFNGTNLLFTPSTRRHTVNHGLTASATLDYPNTTPGGYNDFNITVEGAALGDVVSLGIPNAAMSNNNIIYFAWVSATDLVTVRFANNNNTGDVNPGSGSFKVFVTK